MEQCGCVSESCWHMHMYAPTLHHIDKGNSKFSSMSVYSCLIWMVFCLFGWFFFLRLSKLSKVQGTVLQGVTWNWWEWSNVPFSSILWNVNYLTRNTGEAQSSLQPGFSTHGPPQPGGNTKQWKCMLSDVWILQAVLLSFSFLFHSLDELDLGKSHSMDP